MRARACFKCKEYAVIHPNNPINQSLLKVFDVGHKGHMVVTLDVDEVRDSYSKFEGPNVSA